MDGVSHGRDYVMMVVCIYGGIVASGICSTEKSYHCRLVLYSSCETYSPSSSLSGCLCLVFRRGYRFLFAGMCSMYS